MFAKLQKDMLDPKEVETATTWAKWGVFERCLRVLLSYQQALPSAFSATKFAPSFLLATLLSRKVDLNTLPGAVLRSLLRLLSLTSSGATNWLHTVEKAQRLEDSRSVLTVLLELWVSRRDNPDDIANGNVLALRQLLDGALASFDLFRLGEQWIWLDELRTLVQARQLGVAVRMCSDRVQLFAQADIEVSPLLVYALKNLKTHVPEWSEYICRVFLQTLLQTQTDTADFRRLLVVIDCAVPPALDAWMAKPRVDLGGDDEEEEVDHNNSSLFRRTFARTKMTCDQVLFALFLADKQGADDKLVHRLLTELIGSCKPTTLARQLIKWPLAQTFFLRSHADKVTETDRLVSTLLTTVRPDAGVIRPFEDALRSATHLSWEAKFSLVQSLLPVLSSDCLRQLLDDLTKQPAVLAAFLELSADITRGLTPDFIEHRMLKLARKHPQDLDAALNQLFASLAGVFDQFELIEAAVREGAHVKHCFRQPTGSRVRFLCSLTVSKQGRRLCMQRWLKLSSSQRTEHRQVLLPLLSLLVERATGGRSAAQSRVLPDFLQSLSAVFGEDASNGLVAGSVALSIFQASPGSIQQAIRRSALRSIDLLLLVSKAMSQSSSSWSVEQRASDVYKKTAELFLSRVVALLGDPKLEQVGIAMDVAVRVACEALSYCDAEQRANAMKRLLGNTSSSSSSSSSSSILPAVFRAVLKESFLDERVHSLLQAIVEAVDQPGLCSSLASMVLGHSQLVSALIRDRSTSLVELIYVALAKGEPKNTTALCQLPFVRLLLASYGASLSLFDQQVFRLLVFLEQRGLTILQAGLLWGPYAVDKLSTWQDAAVLELDYDLAIEIMDNCLDRHRLLLSTHEYPLAVEHQLVSVEPRRHTMASAEQLYDPRFLLSVLAELVVSPLFDLNKFMDCGALAYCVSVLTSDSRGLRRLTSSILSRFLRQLETFDRCPERALVQFVLHLVRNTLTCPGDQLPTLLTAFLVESLRIIRTPADPLYRTVGRYLLARPLLDRFDIPLFYDLFHATQEKGHENHRSWILKLLLRGARSVPDLTILRKRRVLELCQTFHDSPFASAGHRALVWRLHASIVDQIPGAAAQLCEYSSLTSWLTTHLYAGTGVSPAFALAKQILAILQRDSPSHRATTIFVREMRLAVRQLGLKRYPIDALLPFVQDLQRSSQEFCLSTATIQLIVAQLNVCQNQVALESLGHAFVRILLGSSQPTCLTRAVNAFFSKYIAENDFTALSQLAFSSKSFHFEGEKPVWLSYLEACDLV